MLVFHVSCSVYSFSSCALWAFYIYQLCNRDAQTSIFNVLKIESLCKVRKGFEKNKYVVIYTCIRMITDEYDNLWITTLN